MSVQLDRQLAETGTKFRIFPQSRVLDFPPETIMVSVSPDQMRQGPADDRMFVIDATNKQPYGSGFGPPYTGAHNSPVSPGPDGHFDHLDVDSREFKCATMYATVRRTLDIWQDYFGRTISWHFETSFARMELIPLIEWDNAQSGFGFLEFGFGRKSNGGIDHAQPYCENFDVLAHELGHSIIFSEVGIPENPADDAIDYGGFQESCGDLVAIISVLHFNSIVDHLLAETRGNLFTVNELDRVGELSKSRQIRIAFNSVRMADVGDEPHERSLPLTGAIFDVLVEVFQKNLVRTGLITQDLADASTQGTGRPQDLEDIQHKFDAAYAGKEAQFKAALLAARDYLGTLLSRTWSSLRPPNFLTYHDILRALLRADRAIAGEHQETIRSCFGWRGITVLPNSLLMRPRSVIDVKAAGRLHTLHPN
jgi:hypothetical protein